MFFVLFAALNGVDGQTEIARESVLVLSSLGLTLRVFKAAAFTVSFSVGRSGMALARICGIDAARLLRAVVARL